MQKKKGKTLVERARGWGSNAAIQCSCIKASKSVLKGKICCFKEVQSGQDRVGSKFSQLVPRPKLRFQSAHVIHCARYWLRHWKYSTKLGAYNFST